MNKDNCSTIPHDDQLSLLNSINPNHTLYPKSTLIKPFIPRVDKVPKTPESL